MSKADELGESTSFATAVRATSRRRELINNATGAAGPASAEPVGEPQRVQPLANLAHNPFNPRAEPTNLQELADSLLERGQIQPLSVVSRAAFLEAHPGHDAELGTAGFIVVDGNRRLAAAILAGLDDLRVDVNDALVATASDLLESALIANIQREDLTPMEEALTLEGLLKVHGSQRNVARRIGKSNVWVSQRLALLELTPDLQQQLETRELTVEEGRKVGKLPKQRQEAAASELKAARLARAPRARQGGNGVNTPAGSAGSGGNGVNTLAGERIDWSNVSYVAALLKEKLDDRQLDLLVNLLALRQ
jgi:ParB family chromosome partitioning protein